MGLGWDQHGTGKDAEWNPDGIRMESAWDRAVSPQPGQQRAVSPQLSGDMRQLVAGVPACHSPAPATADLCPNRHQLTPNALSPAAPAPGPQLGINEREEPPRPDPLPLHFPLTRRNQLGI